MQPPRASAATASKRRDMPKASQKSLADRLHEAWDYTNVPRGDRRTTAVAERYNVSRESARKWSLGLSVPRDERLRAMAVQMGVGYEWLCTGRGPMTSADLEVRDQPNSYDSAELVRLNGLVRSLSRKKRLALIQLLEDER